LKNKLDKNKHFSVNILFSLNIQFYYVLYILTRLTSNFSRCW